MSARSRRVGTQAARDSGTEMPTASSNSNRRQGVEMQKRANMKSPKVRARLGKRKTGMLRKGKNAGGVRARS